MFKIITLTRRCSELRRIEGTRCRKRQVPLLILKKRILTKNKATTATKNNFVSLKYGYPLNYNHLCLVFISKYAKKYKNCDKKGLILKKSAKYFTKFAQCEKF